jgi:hypothetical protein
MAMTTVIQLVDVAIRAWPFRLHSPAWRLGVIGFAANAVGTTMLALLVILAIAIAVGDRGVAYVAAGVSALAGALCLVIAVVFSLDAVQMKTQVQANLANQYDMASVWLVVRMVIGAMMLLLLAVSGFRIAKTVRREAPRSSMKGSGSLVVGTARPGTSSPASSQHTVGIERG